MNTRFLYLITGSSQSVSIYRWEIEAKISVSVSISRFLRLRPLHWTSAAPCLSFSLPASRPAPSAQALWCYVLACGRGVLACRARVHSALFLLYQRPSAAFTRAAKTNPFFCPYGFLFFAEVSFIRRNSNKLTTPRPQDRTLGGLHTAAERIQPAEQEQRPG